MSETPPVLKKIKLLTGPLTNTVGTGQSGDIVDVPEAEADDYIARGLAQFMDEGTTDPPLRTAPKK
jgi:hypothetical protein